MLTIKCARCDESVEVAVRYEMGWGFKLEMPVGWLLSPVGQEFVCPACPAITRSDDAVPAPSPEADDAVGSSQAEEFRRRFIRSSK